MPGPGPDRRDTEARPRLEAAWMRDPAARAVTDALRGGGAKALFVGGCVRNELMGLPVHDIDIATDAPPEDVARMLEAAGIRHVPTGIDHGTLTAVRDNRSFEITTFRKDVETYGRKAEVAFGAELHEDAARRDFTMNALYAEPEGPVLDPLGEGLADLAVRRVRFIGDAHERIREDFLRILRFFRFHALYGDPERGMDPEGLAACAAELDGLAGLARERVGAEIRKLLAAANPGPALSAMGESGALERVLPGADPAALGSLIAAEAEAGSQPDWKRRLLVIGIDPEDAAERLRLSKAETRALRAISAALEEGLPAAQAAYRHGAEAARDAALLRATETGQAPPKRLTKEIARGATASFPVSAGDLIARGMKPGPKLGRKLAELEEAWLRSDFALTRGDLLDG
ncbi:MAG: CCA tRNA nucleotidyltransferase [Pseudomonadota bacterium]